MPNDVVPLAHRTAAFTLSLAITPPSKPTTGKPEPTGVFANAQEIYACELTVTLAERTPAGTDSGLEEDNEARRTCSNHTDAGNVLLAFDNLRTCASDLNQRHRRWFASRNGRRDRQWRATSVPDGARNAGRSGSLTG